MYFIVLMAFALVLTDGLPPRQLDLFRTPPGAEAARGHAYEVFIILAAQVALVVISSMVVTRRSQRRLDGTRAGHEAAAETLSDGQRFLMGLLAAALVFSMLMTPWTRVVREAWGLAAFPLADAIVILAPFLVSVTLTWAILFPVEKRLRMPTPGEVAPPDGDTARADAATGMPAPEAARRPPGPNDALLALKAARKANLDAAPTLGSFVLDKLRHHVLIIAAPMLIVVIGKHYTDLWGPRLVRQFGVPWAGNALLGLVSVLVLFFSPVMLRYVWATEPLPDGPLRRRFERICRRIGLSYREILLWHTHGMAVNAAVMGFVGPMRYILVSDALLESMNEEEIEAVFGHEAGHVRHYHLQYFALFVLAAMYVAGGVLETVVYLFPALNDRSLHGLLQIVALALLLGCWLFGFGWLSRKFERQADLYGIRCLTPDVRDCVPGCPVHGSAPRAGLCLSAANLFGRTLARIAELNGIPREAPSWRHGSIASRCRLVETLATHPRSLARFDRLLVCIKAALLAGVVVGTAAAGWLYYDDLTRLIRMAG